MALAHLVPLLSFVALLDFQTQFVSSAAPTRFSASNPTSCSQLLILGDEVHGPRAQMMIAPGASFETFFASGTLDGVYLEVVCFDPNGWTTSGAVSFQSMLASGVDHLAIELENGASQPWLYTSSGKINGDSGLNLTPESLMSAETTSEPVMLDPNHVPIITSQDVETNDTAPKIRRSNPPI